MFTLKLYTHGGSRRILEVESFHIGAGPAEAWFEISAYFPKPADDPENAKRFDVGPSPYEPNGGRWDYAYVENAAGKTTEKLFPLPQPQSAAAPPTGVEGAEPLPPGSFRKKPIVIEAARWEGCKCGLTTGVGPMGAYPLPEGQRLSAVKLPAVSRVSEEDRAFEGQAVPAGDVWRAGDFLYIGTLEGTHRADPGDWIIRGVKGEIYPCKPDIFEATYDRA